MRKPLHLMLTLIVLFGCGVSAVHAQDFKKLVMPGRVIAGHAEVEGDCAACHAPSALTPQSALCVDCHTEVGADRTGEEGFHGKFSAAASNECAVCHTDHEGRDADIVQAVSSLFDHAMTDFPLLGMHLGLDCGDCHAPDAKHRVTTAECGSCHVANDIHGGALGQDCQNCHVEQAWSETTFNHIAYGYELTGAHAAVACVDCHRGNVFAGTSTGCSSCHAVDDVHGGSKGTDCGSCHNNSSWQGIGFDHFAETGFALADGHEGLDCMDCHSRPDYRDGLAGSCSNCHSGEDNHQGRNGLNCESCHTATDWTDWIFTHAGFGFDLNHRHAELNCSACHKGSTSEPLPASCESCHTFDDSHGGQMRDDCGACHQESSWPAAISFDHDLSGFPLTGTHAALACESCHASNRFHDAPQECVDCHQEDDAHAGTLGNNCSSCHSANEWSVTAFDHDESTGFALLGAHLGTACSACHKESASTLGEVPATCGGCHRNEDVHDGQFGMRCESCHNSSTFSEIENL